MILNALGVFNMQAPPYGSTIFFELHQHNETDHIIKMFYLNDTASEKPFQLPLPGCDINEPCHLGKFFYATEDLIPEDWKRECHLNAEERGPFGSGIYCHHCPRPHVHKHKHHHRKPPTPIHLDYLDDPENPHEELGYKDKPKKPRHEL